MAHYGKRRRSSGGGQDHQPRYPEYTSDHNQDKQAMFHNPPPPQYSQYHRSPPPPLDFTQPPPPFFSYQPPSNPTHHYHYPDPQGVSPPTTPLTAGISILDQSDHSGSRPGSSLSQVSTPGISYSPSVSTTSGNSYSKCSFCSLVFSTISLTTHLSSCHSHLMFHCSLCSDQFVAVPQLRSHMFSRHQVTTFSCDKLAMAGTITLPTDLRLYRCKKCPADQGTLYGSGPHLVSAHLASYHPDVTGSALSSQMVGYECRACHLYQLEGESHLLKHIQLRHSRAREPSVELVAGPVIQDSPSSVELAPVSSSMSSEPTGDTSQTADLTRCNMCPSPGLVHRDQVERHLRDHNTVLFTCAPCKKKFEMYQDAVEHIRSEHRVSQTTTILESIILPARSQLVTLQCGVCSRQFVGQSEQVLVSHIESTHGKFYVGVGGGKNIVLLCRLCGERCRDGGETVKHLDTEHDGDLFARDSDSENTTCEEDTEYIPAQNTTSTKTTSSRVAFMDIFKEEVTRRKAEYDKQEIEKRKLSPVLSSDISSSSEVDSETDASEVATEKKKHKDHKKRKNVRHNKIVATRSKLRSSGSEENSSEDFVYTRKPKCNFTVDKKRKVLLRNTERIRDENQSKLEKSKKRSIEGSSKSDDSSDGAVAHKYHKKCQDDLKKSTYSNVSKRKSRLNKVNLKQSSTEKLLEAKEMIRVSIQKEENSRQVQGKKTPLIPCDAKKISDLNKLKEQLTETLRRSRELTKKMKKKHKDVLVIKDSRIMENLDAIPNRDAEVSDDLNVGSDVGYSDQDSSSKSRCSETIQHSDLGLPTAEPKISKFKMTWKK